MFSVCGFTVRSVCLFVYVFYIFLLLFSNKMIKWKIDSVSWWHEKYNLAHCLIKNEWRLIMIDRIVKTYGDYVHVILICELRSLCILSLN